MNRQERRNNKVRKVNTESIEYKEGVKAGIRQERGNFVQAMGNTKGIGDLLIERVLGEVAKIYKGESK